MAQQERARRTREQALDAAAAEFSAHGYAHTTLGAVAGRIGMTKGALYGHFPSKDHLAEAVVHYARDRWTRTADSAAAGPATPLVTLGRLVRELARLRRTDARTGAALRLAADAIASGTPGPNLLLDVRAQLGALVRGAQERGEITGKFPAVVIVELLLAVILAAPCPSRPATSWVDAVWELFEDSLRP
ncbi:TetR/AcrR family transcriptional regulator [Kitasatospora mediocidica]|uniref:TetR/AcrR family transcriptional regulator n=1 Tax=Kitasatospora mediocidica TaxID=58352 RepID=UPI00068B3FB2|nr:TetR/AcrR family transcriptional regulator [Kitasatospora mediocidica]